MLDVGHQCAQAGGAHQKAVVAVAVVDFLGWQAAHRGQGGVLQQPEDRAVVVRGGVGAGECSFVGGDGDAAARDPVVGVVFGDRLGVGVARGAAYIAGGGGRLALGSGDGVVGPAGQLVGWCDAARVHAGLAAEQVVVVGESVALGVCGRGDLGVDVVGAAGGARVGVGDRGLSAAQIVAVAPGVALGVSARGGLAGRGVRIRGDVCVGGVAGHGGAVVLPQRRGASARVGVGGGRCAALRGRHIDAVRSGVGGGGRPLWLGVGHEGRLGDPAHAVVGVPGLRRHLAVVRYEDRAVRGGGGVVVGAGCLGHPPVRVVHSVGEEASGHRRQRVALGLPEPAEAVVELGGGEVFLALVDALRGHDRGSCDAVDRVGELVVGGQIGRAARDPHGGQAAEAVVLLCGDAAVGVGGDQRQVAPGILVDGGGPPLRAGRGDLGGYRPGGRGECDGGLGGERCRVASGQLVAVHVVGGAVALRVGHRAAVHVEAGGGGVDVHRVAGGVVVVQRLGTGRLGESAGLAERLGVVESAGVADSVGGVRRCPAGAGDGLLLAHQGHQRGVAAGGVFRGGADLRGRGGAVALVVDLQFAVGVRGIAGGNLRGGAPTAVGELALGYGADLVGGVAGHEVGHAAGLLVRRGDALAAAGGAAHADDLAAGLVVDLGGDR